jgi:hypothetical protein
VVPDAQATGGKLSHKTKALGDQVIRKALAIQALAQLNNTFGERFFIQFRQLSGMTIHCFNEFQLAPTAPVKALPHEACNTGHSEIQPTVTYVLALRVIPDRDTWT